MPRRPVTQHNRRMAGPDHAVVELHGGLSTYRRTPCDGCPWIVANTGDFPAEAFKHSAGTAFDASMHTFACHESGQKAPATCAGFLLRNSVHNLAVRLQQSKGVIDLAAVSDGGHELHDSYRDMAVANGVPPDDPAIADCRANWE